MKKILVILFCIGLAYGSISAHAAGQQTFNGDAAQNTLSAKGQLLSAIYGIVSDPANIKALWLGDPATGTTITDRGALAHNATLSADASTLSPITTGAAKNINLTSGVYFSVADHNDFTFGNGAADTAFSIVALINPNALGTTAILGKIDNTTGNTQKEWLFYFGSSKLSMTFYDDSATEYMGRIYNTALTSDIGSFHTYAMTKTTGIIPSACKLYRDGVAVDDTDTNTGSYVAMENKGAAVGNYWTGTDGLRAIIGDYKLGLIMVVAETLTPTQIKRLDMLLRSYAGINL